MKFFVFLILLFSKLSLCSQDQFGVYGSLSHGNLVEYSEVDFFTSDWSHSFGLLYSKKMNEKLNLVGQLGYEKFGWISKNFSGFGPQTDLFMKGKSINLFLGGKYDFIAGNGFKLGILILPKIGYAFKQEQIDVMDNREVLALFAIKRNLLFGLDSKLTFQLSISEFVDFEFRPGFAWFSYFDDDEYTGRILSLDFVFSKRLSSH